MVRTGRAVHVDSADSKLPLLFTESGCGGDPGRGKHWALACDWLTPAPDASAISGLSEQQMHRCTCEFEKLLLLLPSDDIE